MENLYKQIDTAASFTKTDNASVTVDHANQVELGLGLASRAAAAQPAPEPVKVMPPIVPVAN